MLYFLTCLYIAFYYIRPTEWVPGILDMQIFLVLGILCIAVIFEAALSKKIKLLNGGAEMMMLWFVIAIFFSHLSHLYMGGAYDSFLRVFPTIVGYFLIVTAIDSREKFNKIILLIVCLATFLAYEGWLQHTTGFAHGGMDPVIERKINEFGLSFEVTRIRWYGVFNDPNDLGLALVLTLPFLLNMVLEKKYLLPLISAPLITSTIYFTESRGSLLAVLASIMAYFVIRYRSMRGVMVGLVLAAILFTLGPTKMSDISASEDSAYGRIEAWHEGYQMFKANPVFGVGQGMFTDYHNLTAHNSFVLVMAELGLFGLFFYTGIIYYPFNWLWRNIFKSKECLVSDTDLGVLSAVFGSLIGLLAAMFFLSRSYNLVPFILMALATVSTRLCAIDGNSGSASTPLPEKHLKNIAIITVLQIIFIDVMVKVFI